MAGKHDKTVNPDGVDTEEMDRGDTPSSLQHPGAETRENDDRQDRRPDADEVSLDEPSMSPRKKTAGS